MKTLKFIAIKLWNAVINAISLLIGITFLLVGYCSIILCIIGILQFGIKLWLAPGHVVSWIITGVMWLLFGCTIRILCSYVREVAHDIKNNEHIGTDFARKLSIKL